MTRSRSDPSSSHVISVSMKPGAEIRRQSTRILFSTEVTPRAAKAVDPAKYRPTQVSSVPVSCTVPPSAVTSIVSGLNHERRSATMIESLIFDASLGSGFNSSTACFNWLLDMVFYCRVDAAVRHRVFDEVGRGPGSKFRRSRRMAQMNPYIGERACISASENTHVLERTTVRGLGCAANGAPIWTATAPTTRKG